LTRRRRRTSRCTRRRPRYVLAGCNVSPAAAAG